MTVADSIRDKLTEGLAPLRLDIVDDSHRHAGHAGVRHLARGPGAEAGGETHFTVAVVSATFEGKSRVERQRLVYGLLKDELDGPVHALALKTLTPAEDAAGR